jgi:adenosylcobinamide-GDP ribazoletransferase
MKSLVAALRLLTIAPIPGVWGSAEEDLARSLPWFPIVGLGGGVVAAGLAWAMAWAAPPLISAAVLVVVLAGFSGCLHLDGLADTADGLLSSRPRERKLEIMRDSHIGAMGVIAIVGVWSLKFAALASVMPEQLWAAVLIMPLAGRCAIVVQMAILPYARTTGLASVFYRRPRRLAAVWAAGFLAAVAWGLLRLRGLMVWGACVAAALVFSCYVYRRIGGATGDTLGAVCEIVETLPALMLALGPMGQAR